MIETIHPTEALECAVGAVFDQVTTEMTVTDFKAKIKESIRKAACEFEEWQQQCIEQKLPAYLLDIFDGCKDSTRVGDPDHFRSNAVGLVELNFREIYHGKA